MKNNTIERRVLLNPGPATTSDTVKMAQVVPDICPREEEFAAVMDEVEKGLLEVVHADAEKYAAVLFCGSGTICIDICLNSLLPEGKKALIIHNGAYSKRAMDVCDYYGIEYVEYALEYTDTPDMVQVEKYLLRDDVVFVYITHHETGSGLLNPIRDVGEIAHKYGKFMVADTTSSYAMIPIDIEKDNVDFCMASAQKGIMSMTGLSFVIGKRSLIEESANYPKRSYYTNLFRQYDYRRKNGQMHFTPPVQTMYATRQALIEYRNEGEIHKWNRHKAVFDKIWDELSKLGFRNYLPKEKLSHLVASPLYPDDANWDFKKIHDFCYERGFTIYPGKIGDKDTFRLCALGTLTPKDIEDFFLVFKASLKEMCVVVPVRYKDEN